MKSSTFGLGLKEEVVSFSHLARGVARGINVDVGEGVVGGVLFVGRFRNNPERYQLPVLVAYPKYILTSSRYQISVE